MENVENTGGLGISIPQIIDNPNRKSLKVWSESLGRYYYKSKDPNYYKDYFHKMKRPMICEFCGKTVNCQFYSHLKSKHCTMKRQEQELNKLKQELEKLNSETIL